MQPLVRISRPPSSVHAGPSLTESDSDLFGVVVSAGSVSCAAPVPAPLLHPAAAATILTLRSCTFHPVMITFLHHSDPTIPHFRKEEWSFLRGAASTVDRPTLGWIGRVFLHNVRTPR